MSVFRRDDTPFIFFNDRDEDMQPPIQVSPPDGNPVSTTARTGTNQYSGYYSNVIDQMGVLELHETSAPSPSREIPPTLTRSPSMPQLEIIRARPRDDFWVDAIPDLLSVSASSDAGSPRDETMLGLPAYVSYGHTHPLISRLNSLTLVHFDHRIAILDCIQTSLS